METFLFTEASEYLLDEDGSTLILDEILFWEPTPRVTAPQIWLPS